MNPVTWTQAVLDALHRYSARHQTRIITRQNLIREEMDTIQKSVNSRGQTPTQTLSRILQELRAAGSIEFSDDNGTYYLIDTPLDIDREDLPELVLDQAILYNRLAISDVPTADELVIGRRRKGQSRVRTLTLKNYQNGCAMCDIGYARLLVASHIVRWADNPQARGNLANVLCLCSIHDALFESGFVALADDFTILKRDIDDSEFLYTILAATRQFRQPRLILPDPTFLAAHRRHHAFA